MEIRLIIKSRPHLLFSLQGTPLYYSTKHKTMEYYSFSTILVGSSTANVNIARL